MSGSIAVVPGDGIGPEVVDAGLFLLDAMGFGFSVDVLDHVNADRFLATGVAMSDDDMARAQAATCVLLGAVGDPRVGDPAYARGVLLRLRSELDLYVNHRPAVLFDDRLSPLRDPARRAIDCVVVRENTEGIYVGSGGTLRHSSPHEVAVDNDISTRFGVSRVLRYAFSVARRSVCMVDKANAIPFGGGLWQRCYAEEAVAYPDLERTHLYVDAAAMKLVHDPTAFDVIVTNNLFGDVLSDLTAQLAGGLGMAASANLNPETGKCLFEPVHGSAPDIAGRNIANPLGIVLSIALMLDHLGHTVEAEAVRVAVGSTVRSGLCTPDLGGDLSTKDAVAAVVAELH